VSGDDLKYTHELLKSELDTYNTELVYKKNRVVFTKTDLITHEELEEKISEFGEDVISISALSDENIKYLIYEIRNLMEQQGEEE
jgi:GTPase involved in cell partitioning and DNA repair